jgi:hypothetical protein
MSNIGSVGKRNPEANAVSAGEAAEANPAQVQATAAAIFFILVFIMDLPRW